MPRFDVELLSLDRKWLMLNTLRNRLDKDNLVLTDISDRIEKVPEDTDVMDERRPESSDGAGEGTDDAVDDKEGGRSAGTP